MKGIKTILGIALATAGFGGAVSVGAGAVVNNQNNQAQMVEAAGTKTFYLVRNWDWGTPKIHYWGGENPTTWGSNPNMTKVADSYTVGDVTGPVYSYDVPTNSTGIIIRDSAGSQRTANYEFSAWGSVATNGAYFSYTNNQNKLNACNYSPSYTITKYAVVDGVKESASIGSDSVSSGTTYNVPAKIFKSGYSFDGWYTNETCTSAYTARAINSNMSLYAKYTSGTWEGTVNVDLRGSGWAGAAANYAIYFWDSSTYPSTINGWSSYVTGTASGEHLVSISYDLDFEPKSMSVVRYKNTYTVQNWNSNKWPGGDNSWGQSQDLSVTSMVIMRSDVSDGKNQAYTGFVRVLGGTNSWSEIASLNSVKSNGSHNVEYYSDAVTLTAGQEFKIVDVDDTYYGGYSTHDSIEDNFNGDGTNNISVVTSGTYAFYFDSITHNTYITKVSIADADEWAQTFTSGMVCDGNGNITTDGWTSLSASYNALSADAKAIFIAVAEDGDENGSFVEKAICRYDYIVKKYGTTAKPDFMGRISAGKIHMTSRISISAMQNQTYIPLVIVISSLIGLTGTLAYFFLKKKEN